MPQAIWIPEYLSNGRTESDDDQTLLIDLPKNEQIGMLMLEIRVTNTATVNNLRSILDMMGDIEVRADGVKTLFSCSAEIASYLAFVARDGVLPDHRFFDTASTVSRLHLPIYFGRFPWDEDYLLDTGLYKNVQLRIPYALNTTYEATGTFQHTLTYWRPLERVSPLGIVRSTIVKRETPAAAIQTRTHDLPTEFPWHYVGVRVIDDDADLNSDLTGVDLNVDAGRLHLLDVDADEVNYMDRLRYAQANAYVSMLAPTGIETVHTFGDWPFSFGTTHHGLSAQFVTVTNIQGENARIAVYDDAGAAETGAVGVSYDSRSPNPHKCLTLFDGRRAPFPAPGHREAKIEYALAALGMTLETFVQELVPGAL